MQGPFAEIHGVDRVVNQLRAEALGMPLHTLHELGALHAVVVARPVIHVGRRRHLTADLDACDDHRLERSSRGIYSGGVSSGSGTDNDEFVMIACHCYLSARDFS